MQTSPACRRLCSCGSPIQAKSQAEAIKNTAPNKNIKII